MIPKRTVLIYLGSAVAMAVWTILGGFRVISARDEQFIPTLQAHLSVSHPDAVKIWGMLIQGFLKSGLFSLAGLVGVYLVLAAGCMLFSWRRTGRERKRLLAMLAKNSEPLVIAIVVAYALIIYFLYTPLFIYLLLGAAVVLLALGIACGYKTLRTLTPSSPS